MASLPPKPVESPPREKDERRYPTDDRDRRAARPMGQARYPGRFEGEGSVYTPSRIRSANMDYDSYVSYDNRREDNKREDNRREDIRRMEYSNRERERGRDARDRDYDYRDRERGSRFPQSSHGYDRNRRGYERERGSGRADTYVPSPSRQRESYDPSRRHSPSRRGSYYRRSSRSPRRRSSPSRSPPPKRLKLGNHSIGTSPSSLTPSRDDHDPPISKPGQKPGEPQDDLAHTSINNPAICPSNIRTGQTPNQTAAECKTEYRTPSPSELEPTNTKTISATQRSRSGGQKDASTLTPVAPEAIDIVVSPDDEPHASVEAIKETEVVAEKTPIVTTHDRSPSPPKHPRLWNVQPREAAHHRRRVSRSPPRGPRNYPRSNTNPTPTAPASFQPTGPRTMRRQQQVVPLSTPPAPQKTPPPVLAEVAPPPIASKSEPKVSLPTIPPYKPRPSLAPELDLEVSRLQTYRAHLNSEYAHISKGTRRAFHELDMATIDLRAAESRRRVADSHVEMARNGVLGIDAVPIETPIV